MQTPADYVVVCPILVGREPALGALDRTVSAVIAGHGQIMAISGEAGLGKSRLVAEAHSKAAEAQLRVMQGHCFEPDASLPYAPIVDLLRAYIGTHDHGGLVDCIGPDAPEIVKILPELMGLITDLTPAPAVDPEQEKRRILHGLGQFFARAASRGPLLVVIEDLHWSDDTSLEFLALLARRIKSLPVFLLLTYRSDEVRLALAGFLAGLDRERLGTEWPLARLTTGEVRDMISAIFELTTPPRPEFIDAMYSLTEGNPFFLEEVLKSLVASGGIFFKEGTWDRKPIEELQIPRSVHAAVANRTKHLSDGAGDVLRVAAIAGRRFDFQLLLRLTSLDEEALLKIIKELIAAQLVVEESADHFSFRHALTQQAIYSDLLARERRTLHRTIGETMREMYGTEVELHLPDLAYHFYAAEAWDEAFYYCQRVAQNAQTLNATRAAMEQFTRAIDAATHLRVKVAPALFRSRGQTYETLGSFDHARADYETALAGAQSAKEGVGEWQSLIDLGFLWSGRDYERSGVYFQRAFELAEAIGDPRLRARSMNRVGNWLVNMGRPSEGLAHHASALAIFESEHDTLGTAETLDLIGMANGIFGDLPAGVAAFTRSIELLRPLGPSIALASSLTSRSTYCSSNLAEPVRTAQGSMEDVRRDADEAARMAEQIGSPAAMSFAAWAGGGSAAAFGELGYGLAQAAEGLRLASEIGHAQWIVGARYTLGRIYVLALAPEDAVEQLDAALRLAREVGSAWWIGNTTTGLALAHLLRNDTASAEAVLTAFRPRDHEPQSLAERRVRWVWGLLALARGDEPVALEIAEALLSTSMGGRNDQRIPLLQHLRGNALHALKKHDEALAALELARDCAIEQGARPFLWQIHCSLGKLHHEQRRTVDAERELGAARAVIGSLAATLDDDALRVRFERVAASELPRPRSVTANQAAKDAFGGLTSREREVAALIGGGLSNRDMAERLVLGERTIETHVGNVLSKLGFTSRAQVAVWAVQKGLTERS